MRMRKPSASHVGGSGRNGTAHFGAPWRNHAGNPLTDPPVPRSNPACGNHGRRCLAAFVVFAKGRYFSRDGNGVCSPAAMSLPGAHVTCSLDLRRIGRRAGSARGRWRHAAVMHVSCPRTQLHVASCGWAGPGVTHAACGEPPPRCAPRPAPRFAAASARRVRREPHHALLIGRRVAAAAPQPAPNNARDAAALPTAIEPPAGVIRRWLPASNPSSSHRSSPHWSSSHRLSRFVVAASSQSRSALSWCPLSPCERSHPPLSPRLPSCPQGGAVS